MTDESQNMNEEPIEVIRAILAEQAERYEDMVNQMKKLVQTRGSPESGKTVSLCNKERNLLSVAYKNVVGARRSSWRVLTNIEGKNEQLDENKKQLIKEYKANISKELKDICNEVIELLDKYLLKEEDSQKGDPGDVSPIVFYLKMKGDYYRYLAEVTSESQMVTNSKDAYQAAMDTATSGLEPTHPIRLGLALNFSVFHYEIGNDQKKACELAKCAFDAAISELEKLNEESYKDSTLIMQLLRDNLTLWKGDDNEAEQAAN